MDIFSEQYCRLCLKDASRRVKLHKIDKNIEESYYDLTQKNLSKNSIFSSLSRSICENCNKELFNCIHTKVKFKEKQAELERKVSEVYNNIDVKTEPLNDPILVNPDVDVKAESDNDTSKDEFEISQIFLDREDSSDNVESDEDFKDSLTESSLKELLSLNVTATNDSRKQCTICKSAVKNLKEHMKYTHNQARKNYFCDRCSFSCYFRHKMEVHAQCHIPKEFRNMITCPHCDYMCTRKDSLTKHITSIHSGDRKKTFNCEECNKSYYNISSLNIHIKTVHRNIRNFSCPECGKKFYTSKDLKLHVPRHFEKKEKCPQCDLLFFTQAEVRSHNKRVHLPPTIKCTYEGCEKMFPSNEKLKMHVNVRHERLKNFVCVQCGAAFAQYNTLKRHNDTVHKSLRVQCPIDNCGFSMKRKERFIKHLNKYHAELDEHTKENIIKNLKYETEAEHNHVKEFICPDCGKVFTKYHNLKNHIKKGHDKKVYLPKIIYCPIENCTYKCTRKYRFKGHLLKSHQYIDEQTRETILKDIKYDTNISN